MQSEDLIRIVWRGCSRGKFFVGLGGRDFLQSAAVALVLRGVCDSLGLPYMSAEIPPAGAPSGFDSAAMFDFTA